MKKYIFGGIILVFLIAFLYYFFAPSKFALSNDERNKALKEILGREVRKGKEEIGGSLKYENKYLIFDYPASAKIYGYNRENILKQTFVLDSFQFQKIDNPKYIAVFEARSSSSAASLSEQTGVSFREKNKDYVKEEIMVGGVEGIIFTKDNDDGYEKSVFFHNGNYYSFVVSAPAKENVIQPFDLFSESLVFKD